MIRNIRLEDAKAIRDISEVSLGYKTTEAVTERQIAKLISDNRHFIRVYEDDETHTVAGFIHAESYELLYKEPGFNILGLALLSEYQHKGIGKQLVHAVEAEAAARNYRFIRLNSGEHRTEAHAFYEHCGYSCTKLQKRFIKEW
ncbi:GNAT family N-acetyltransferase [Treponema sp. OMZ 305]|uniref:GNAT family N-acetyltransferase n=1 Tax=Treponema TaxID=157 RepID=UPI001BAECE22|nr:MULTISPECIES: GNAT family N-acetyltransferase [Treponema]QUY18459.1 GNAT family N-acetyltransferase [Treponema vincentii]UTC58337.1 GNAT family N-acetyltransferase [Treponema sp. OMZ 305]